MRGKGLPHISYIIFILGWLKSRPKFARGCLIHNVTWKSHNFFLRCIPFHSFVIDISLS